MARPFAQVYRGGIENENELMMALRGHSEAIRMVQHYLRNL